MQMPPLSLIATLGGRGRLARFISRAKRCLGSFFLGPNRVNSIGPAPNSTDETFIHFPRKENIFINEEITFKHDMEEMKCEAEEEVKSEEEGEVYSEWVNDAMRLKKEMLDQVIQGLKEEGEHVREKLNKLAEEVTQELENIDEQVVMQELKEQEKLQRPRRNKLAEQVKLELKDLDWLMKQKKELGQEEDKLRKKIRLSLQVMKEQKQRVTHVNELKEQLIPKERWMVELKKHEDQQQQISDGRNLEDLDLPELKEMEEKVMQRLNDLDWHVKQKMELEEKTKAEKLGKTMEVTKLANNIVLER